MSNPLIWLLEHTHLSLDWSNWAMYCHLLIDSFHNVNTYIDKLLVKVVVPMTHPTCDTDTLTTQDTQSLLQTWIQAFGFLITLFGCLPHDSPQSTKFAGDKISYGWTLWFLNISIANAGSLKFHDISCWKQTVSASIVFPKTRAWVYNLLRPGVWSGTHVVKQTGSIFGMWWICYITMQ